jgi:hypothetical protein
MYGCDLYYYYYFCCYYGAFVGLLENAQPCTAAIDRFVCSLLIMQLFIQFYPSLHRVIAARTRRGAPWQRCGEEGAAQRGGPDGGRRKGA